MDFWISASTADTRQLTGLARKAEQVGFAGISLGEHLFTPARTDSPYPGTPDGRIPWPPDMEFPDIWVAVGAMAAVTERLRFTASVYILPARNVFVTAKAVGTAAVISGDRVVLGAGLGWMREEYRAMGEDFATRGPRIDEIIAVLRTLWAGGMVEHHGRFYGFAPLQMSPAPGRPVPIWIGGTSDAALRRAARLGDGWIGVRHTTEEIERIRARLNALRAEAGRADWPFEILVGLKDPPAPDRLRRLEDHGVRNILTRPWNRCEGDMSSLAAKERALERFAEDVLLPTAR